MESGIDVRVIETSSLGDRSYLANDGEAALVVDPQRDVDRIIALAGRLGTRITHVVETHIHNDYVSGGLELCRLTGATYAMAAADHVAFQRTPLSDGDLLEVSPRMRVRAVATPGHTFHHLAYVLEGPDGTEGVFTGGSLLFGTTGRTDLLGREHAEALARRQHASAHRLADLLPEGAQVWPTHGFGGFCSAARAEGGTSTVGRERERNPALRLAADEFVAHTLAGLDTYPAYYAHMGVTNLAGPEPVDLRPPAVADPHHLRLRLAAGEWVVDLRNRKAYARAHLAGTVSLALDGPMATWLGWLIDWGAPLTLLGQSADEVARAQRDLVRIGIDRVAAAATGTPEQMAAEPGQVRSTDTADFADLAAALEGRVPDGLPEPGAVLDVRLGREWEGSHVAGAVHIPLPELSRRVDEVPEGAVWVHCGGGYRATAAASLLARVGRRVVVVDDDFATAADQGVPVTASA
ncbi:MBL fold metallo-hydrolase [Nocardiopsis sp. CNT312]|uniref:MBL fold metallo-hydrolase n=1 Tax=Nocardiopsis sp. CNT312 TaxID=1137268 RepID=UPI0004AF5B2C|nr:MBL fold metallo-hydrolase [Nocardiopsis sp. CNT312]